MAPVMAALGAVGGFLASNATAIGTALSVGGALLGAGGTIYAGAQNAAFAKEQAKEMKKKGDQEYAIAQRRAMQSRREKRAALGRIQAVAAASGGGTGDTVTDIMTGVEQRGEYNALTDLYNGAITRNDLYTGAAITGEQGKMAKKASLLEAGTSLVSSAGTIYGDYWRRKQAQKAYENEMGM